MTSINRDRAQALQDAKQQIGFYYTVKVYHTILRFHGLPEVGDRVPQRARDVRHRRDGGRDPGRLVDEIAIAGTPDEARDRLAQWDELCDEVLFYAPTVGVPPERVRANNDAILDVFGTAG